MGPRWIRCVASGPHSRSKLAREARAGARLVPARVCASGQPGAPVRGGFLPLGSGTMLGTHSQGHSSARGRPRSQGSPPRPGPPPPPASRPFVRHYCCHGNPAASHDFRAGRGARWARLVSRQRSRTISQMAQEAGKPLGGGKLSRKTRSCTRELEVGVGGVPRLPDGAGRGPRLPGWLRPQFPFPQSGTRPQMGLSLLAAFATNRAAPSHLPEASAQGP